MSAGFLLRVAVLFSVEVVHPRVAVGALPLAGGPGALLTTVRDLAGLLLLGAPGWSVDKVAAQGRRGQERFEGFRVLGPVDQLLAGDEVDVRQGQDGVEELEEAVLAVLAVEEPGRVEEERERGLGLGVVLQEVLGEDLLNGLNVFVVEASVGHGAGSAPDVLQDGHRDLPHVRVRHDRAGLDSAGVRDLEVQAVGPGRVRG